MIQSHPYSLTSELFPSPRPGLHITQHCACRLCSPPLLFHTFCLAFKSSSFTYPPDLPTVKKKSWHSITSKRLGKLFRASHGAPFPHRNYCWNKQLWEVAALVDPSLLTISEPLSAIAKTLSHRRAVMIALPSWGRKKKKKKRMIRERERRAIAGFFFITSREAAPELKPPKLKKCFKPKATQTCQTAISVSMVIRHSPTPSGELQIYYTHAAVSRMLSLRWCPVLGSQLPVNTEGWRTPDCLFVSRQHSGPFLPQSHFTLLEECFACATNLFLPKHVFLCHTYWEPVTNQFFRRTGTVTLLWHCGHMCERDCEEWRTCIFYMILQLQHKQKVRSVM